MINIIERQFDKLSKKIKERASSLLKRFGAYLKRLLFPLYLFPIKLITYTAYYKIICFHLRGGTTFVIQNFSLVILRNKVTKDLLPAGRQGLFLISLLVKREKHEV